MRLRPSQRWSRVVWWTSNNVSEEPAVSSFWASRFLWIHQNARHHMPEDPILALPRELQLWHDTGLICYSLWLRISLLRCIAVSLSAFGGGGSLPMIRTIWPRSLGQHVASPLFSFSSLSSLYKLPTSSTIFQYLFLFRVYFGNLFIHSLPVLRPLFSTVQTLFIYEK
jgi:hypothetical protein